MIVLDIEGSGPNFWKHCILSIGAVDFNDPKRQFYAECRLREGALVDEEGLEVNGFSREEINDPLKITERELIENFFAWAALCKDHTIAGHNPSWDVYMLQYASELYSLNFPLAHRMIDLHSVAYMHFIKSGLTPPIEKERTALNSDAVMKYVGIPEEPKPHNALNGAKWEAEAFSRLFYDKNIFDEFQQYKIPWTQ